MDIRLFNSSVDGYLKRRETKINDDLLVGHITAGKISAAVWGDKSFKKPIKPIKLTEENTNESRNKKVLACLKAKGII